MPPRSKAVHSLSGFLDSDDAQSDVDMMPTPDSNQENKVAPKVKRGGKTAGTTRRGGATKPASKRLSAGKSKTLARSRAAKRAPLKDQTNEGPQSETEEVDDFDEIEPEPEFEVKEPEPLQAKKPAKRGRPAGKGKKAATVTEEAATVKNVDGLQRDGEFEYTPTTTKITKPRGRGKKKAVESEGEADEIATTAEMETTVLSIEEEPSITAVPQQSRQIPSIARQPQSHTTANARRRAGSASDTEKTVGDPTLRRKLGDVTRKFENLELKYKNLRDVGIKEAEANFDRLRKQSEERTKAANDLVSSLRSELAIQKDVNKDARNYQSDLSASQSSLKDAEKRISELTNALTQAHNDTRNLQAKLAAARASSATTESKVPGSAMKGKNVAGKPAGTDSSSHVAQLKEELYSDLTGLILRSVTRQDDEDIYDCIQTGRNGTLHFKLAVAVDKDNSVPYEETEFLYTPRLDENRDRDLIEILPDYLTEEITFSRVNAAKFYSRVVDTLTRRME